MGIGVRGSLPVFLLFQQAPEPEPHLRLVALALQCSMVGNLGLLPESGSRDAFGLSQFRDPVRTCPTEIGQTLWVQRAHEPAAIGSTLQAAAEPKMICWYAPLSLDCRAPCRNGCQIQ